MKEKNQIGKMISHERSNAKLTITQLSRGLCSRTFLVRVENGERACEKILADALLQRVGVSADKFVYMINPDEQDWLILRGDLIETVENGQEKKAAFLMKQYQTMAVKKSRLHYQFLGFLQVMLEFKMGSDCFTMLKLLQEAWEISMEDIPIERFEEENLTLTEFMIVMMYYRIKEQCESKDFAIAGYEKLLHHLEGYTDEEDRVKLYPQIAYRLVELYLEKNDEKRAVELAEAGIDMLTVRGRLFCLRQFLEVIAAHGNKTPEEKQKIGQICDSIRWIYREFSVDEQMWVWNIPFGMSEVELCGRLIRSRRKVLGYTQEGLSEDICDPVTISRIECGKVTPKRRIFQMLMERVGLSGGNFELLVQVERPELSELAVRISVLLSHSRGEEAEVLITELEQKMKLNNISAKQYLLSAKALALFNQKKIDDRTHTERQEEALYLTLPKVSLEKLADWTFTSQEVSIIQALSYSCGADHREEESIRLLRIVQKQYESKPFDLSHYVAGYELTMRSLGNVLGNVGQYEEAIEASKKSILAGLKAGRGAVLKLALYDTGWDIEQLWTSGKYTKKESFPYMKASYALYLLFGKQSTNEFIRKHIETYYGTDVKF